MFNLPHDLYTAEQTRELDRIATDVHNITSSELMTRAGASALAAIKQLWPKAKHIVILCGPGNNGGDGFELARQAAANSYQVSTFDTGNQEQLPQTAAAARKALLATGAEIQHFKGKLPSADVIVDALFGTGINRAIEGEAADIIQAINASKQVPILSLDIPSGLHADTGSPLGATVNATVTLSYIGLNIGLYTCLLYTSPSPRDRTRSRMPSSA